MTIKIKDTDFTEKEHKMLMRSFDFINANKEITTEHLPDEFIEFWSVKDFTTTLLRNVNDVQMSVLIHILEMYRFPKKEKEYIFSAVGFTLLLYNFQIILAAVAYSRKSHIPIEPYPIFDVKKYIAPNFDCAGALMRQYEIITRGKMM